MSFFDGYGRRIPNEDYRLFASSPNNAYLPSFYYKYEKPNIDYKKILDNSKEFFSLDHSVSVESFSIACEKIRKKISENSKFENILNGVCVPFILSIDEYQDLGSYFEDKYLQGINNSFLNHYPNSHFKAVLQSDTKLKGNISFAENVGYEDFVKCAKNNITAGLFFPEALQEYDIDSQRLQMLELEFDQICLSGGFDICAAVGGYPSLLISENFYTPIICMSAFKHIDERLMMCLKSYGPHLEFWNMSQMLTPSIKQVSEQWAGGLTFFEKI